MITAGASAYPRTIDFARMRQIADSVGAYLFVDMAHIAGLVAGGVHPIPVPHAHFVTTTTHKSLRGPRAGLIMCKQEFAKRLDAQAFPGVQGGPLMHVIAAKAVCLHEALQPGFAEYARQIVNNAKALAARLAMLGYRIVSGGTDNHLMLVDLRPRGLTGVEAQTALDHAAITVNKNAIPFDTEAITKTGGIRVGTPAMTTRGMKEEEMMEIADLIHATLENRTDPGEARGDTERGHSIHQPAFRFRRRCQRLIRIELDPGHLAELANVAASPAARPGAARKRRSKDPRSKAKPNGCAGSPQGARNPPEVLRRASASDTGPEIRRSSRAS